MFEENALPFAPITRPEDLFDDPHLLATGGLASMLLPDSQATLAPLMPITLQDERLGVRSNPPRLGQHTNALLVEAGYSAARIEALKAEKAIL